MSSAQIYSVYDYDTRSYDYFAAPLGEVPSSGHFRHAMSELAEGLAVPLPPNAVHVGRGETAQGIIASHGIAGIGGVGIGTVLFFGLLAGAAYWAWTKWGGKE